MTHPVQDNTLINQLVNQISTHGCDGAAEVLRLLLNQAMEIERAQALGATPYERTETRKGYANGFKPKTLQTRVGNITLKVPQVRGEIEYYPSVLEKGVRSERALLMAAAEMYIQGVSTRSVEAVLRQLDENLQISPTQVSKATALLEEQLGVWRNRPLGDLAIPYLILDARYEKVRVDGTVIDCAVLVAYGVNETGKRSVLGTSIELSEAEIHWRKFLKSLQERGLRDVKFIVSDDHPGLRAACRAHLPSIPWQRCQFHLQQNAVHHVPKVAMRKTVAAQLRKIFDAPTLDLAQALLKTMVGKHSKTAPKLASWLEANVPEGFAVYALPPEHRKRMRTSNGAERVNQELKRRTRVIRVFPNTKSLLRLVSAILNDIDDKWETSRQDYLNMNPPSQQYPA
jgi:transposase-like protein